jgi:membrane fusion protein, multidrug efflux system
MKLSTIIAGSALVLVIGGAIGGLAWYKWRQLEKAKQNQVAYEPAETVELVDARNVMWNPTADLVGTVIANRSVAIRNEFAGVIKTLGFDSGTVIEAGQPIVTLDDSAELADLDAAKAFVRIAEASVLQSDSRVFLAERMDERMRKVDEQNVTEMELDRTKTELDAARAERQRLQAEVDQAKARVHQVEVRIAKFKIAAPFKARAGIRVVHEGQYLAEGADIVMLHEVTDTIFLDFAIPQEYAPRVNPGTAVMATGAILGPDPVRLEVVAVDAQVNNNTRNLRVRAIVDNRRGVLVPGMFVQIRVPVEEPKPFVMVPGTAIRRASHADSVFIVKPGEKPNEMRAHQRFIEVGPAVGDDVIVLKGLEPGDKIASTGSFKLHEGALVIPAPPKNGQAAK